MVDADSTDDEYRACKLAGLWTLGWAAIILEERGVHLRPVTLRKYCERGRIGVKLAGAWLLSSADLDFVVSMPLEDRRPGRRK